MMPRSLFSSTAAVHLLALSAIPLLLKAQAPALEWENALGSTSYDYGYDIQQTADGGYILTGWIWTNDADVLGGWGSGDAWVVKLDAVGSMVWQKALGGTGGDWGNAVEQTTDGGYIVAGQCRTNDGDISGYHGGFGDAWVVKLDAAGAIQWQHALGGSSAEEAYGIHQTSDGGYVVVGFTNSSDGDVTSNNGGGDAWLVKLDASGALQWQKTFGGSQWDDARQVRQTSDGGYIVAGNTASDNGDVTGNHASEDGWVVKLDDAGDLEWQISLGGTEIDAMISVELATDSGYIVAGFTHSDDGDVVGWHGGTGSIGQPLSDGWIVKLSNTGTIDWQKTLGGTSGDGLWEIQRTIDGGYAVAGSTGSDDGDVSGTNGASDLWVVRIDGSGTIQWQEPLGGTDEDRGHCLDLTNDGGYVAAGNSGSDDGDVSDNQGEADFWIVKLASDGTGIPDATGLAFSVVHDPAAAQLHITAGVAMQNAGIILSDVMGREVLHTAMKSSVHVIDVSGLPCGVYLVTLRTATGERTQRLVLE